MEATHEQTFRVRDLSTRSVTLTPTQAQVVRDIKDIALQPGTNEITILGFTPTADQDSFKVEGAGAAVISDMSVKLLPNRELFSDVYPDMDSADDSNDSDSSDTESDQAEDKSLLVLQIKGMHKQLLGLHDSRHKAQELVASAESRLRHLDHYCSSLEAGKDVVLEDCIVQYKEQRASAFSDHLRGLQDVRLLDGQITDLKEKKRRLMKRQSKIDKAAERLKKKARRLRQMEQHKVRIRREEERKERQRVRQQLESLWPRECYRMVVTLEVAGYTPTSSRRSSVSSMTETGRTVVVSTAVAGDSKGDGGEGSWDEKDAALSAPPVLCDLTVSYVTSSAYWKPTYDLQLSTTANTAVLCFDALLYNRTSESFSNCKLSLSTSQTTYSGLKDKIPSLTPWQIRLVKSGSANGNGLGNIVCSEAENLALRRWKETTKNPTAEDDGNRDDLFGVDESTAFYYRYPSYTTPTPDWMSNIHPSYGSTAFASNNPPPTMVASRPAMASSGMAPRKQLASKACRKSAPARAARMPGSDEEEEEDDDDEDEDMGYGLFDEGMPAAAPKPKPKLDFQESAQEETGLTMTYDLPGFKSLESGARQLKQRVVRIRYPGPASVVFQHVVVAKYRPTAYLRARIRNTSRVTLLRGPAGLTVDGSFIGRSMLPRCSAGDSFTLNLGIDPTIRVSYPRPGVRRASSGMLFSKEQSGSFHRAITIVNTRGPIKNDVGERQKDRKDGKDKNSASRTASLIVLDQVPISQDEKLRVEIQKPRQLAVDGAPVAAGVAASVGSASLSDGSASSFSSTVAKDWGQATATLQKAGEIVWNVQLHAGRGVTLELDYDVNMPIGESVAEYNSSDYLGF